MAESYRGLTVKIGGDTTSLQNALKAASSAAAQTQGQLRRIRSALSMDPSSTEALAMKLRLAGERAVSLNSRLSTLKGALAQLDEKGIGRVADETENASLRAAQAKDAYNAVTAELARMYNQIERATGLDPEGNMKLSKISEEAREAYEEFKRLSGIDLTKNVNAQEAVQSMRELGLVTDDVADRVRELGDAHQQAQAELELSKQVAQYRDLKVEITRTTSELSEMSREIANMQLARFDTAQFAKANAEIKQLDAAAGTLDSQLRRVNEALSLNPRDAEAVALKITTLGQQAEVAQSKLGLVQQKLDALRSAGVDKVAASQKDVAAYAEETARRYAEMTQRASAAKAEVANLEAEAKGLETTGKASGEAWERLQSDISEAKAKLAALNDEAERSKSAMETGQMAKEYEELGVAAAEARAKVASANDELKSMGKSGSFQTNLKALGATLTGSLTPAIVGFASKAVDAADTMDSAFRNMKKTVDGTEQQFEGLRKAAVDFSMSHVTTADQILEIQSLGGQMGVAVEGLQSFAEVISNLDIATDINAEDAATQLGQLASITHMTSDEYSKFGDAIVRLGNNMPSQESAIMDVSSRIGSMSTLMGMSVPQILAWSNAIASTGQNSESAGTAISNTMSDIEAAVGAGGDKLATFAEVAGMSAEQFKNEWGNNASGTLKAFIQGLKSLEESGDSATNKLSELGINGAQQTRALLGLTQTVDTLDDSLAMSQDAWDGVSDQWGAAGDAAREAAQKSEGFSGALGRLQNTFTALKAELGEAAAPSITMAADALKELYEAFSSLPDGAKSAVVGLGGLAAAAGPVITSASVTRDAFSKLRGTLTPSNKALLEAVQASVGVSSGMSGVKEAAASAASATGKLAVSQKAFNVAAGVGSKALSLLKYGAVAGGVMLLVAAYNHYAEQQKKAAERQELLTSATRTFADVARDAASGAKSQAKGLGEVKSGAEECLQSLSELNSSTGERLSSLETEKATLDEYVRTIDELGGKSSLTATEQERLKSAVAGYNKITGESVEVTDASTGSLSKSTEEIDKNAEAWKRNAEAQAYQELGVEYTKQQASAKLALEKANANLAEEQSKLSKVTEEWHQLVGDGTDLTVLQTDKAQKLAQELTKQQEATKGARTEVLEAQSAYNSASESVDQLAASAAALTEEVAPFKQALVDMGEEAQSAAGDMHLTMDQLAVKLQEGGVSIEALEGIGSEGFANLAAACHGSIDDMIEMLVSYNGTPLLDKEGKVQVDYAKVMDAYGNVLIWNDGRLEDKSGNAIVYYTEVTDAMGQVYTWNGTELLPKEATAESKGNIPDGSAEEKVEDYNDAVDDIKDKSPTLDAKGNVIDGDAATKTWDLVEAIRNLNDKEVTVSVKQRATYTAVHLPNAAGGFRGAPQYHADGGIVTRAALIDATNIVGEAGAEAIVPLTNRRYAQPFVDMIADAVNSRVAESVREAVDHSQMAARALEWERELSALASEPTDVRVSLDTDGMAQKVASAVRRGLDGLATGNNYYIGDTRVTTMGEREFADAFVRLMVEFGRLEMT